MPTIIWTLCRGLAQLVVVLYPGILVFWLVMHINIEHWRKVGKRAYWIAAIGWPSIGGPILYFRREVFSVRWYSAELAGVGAISMVIAIVIGWQASKRIPVRTLVGLSELQPQKTLQPLIETGIYSKTRNPIYLAHWLFIFSTAAFTSFAANWILFGLDCIVLPLMLRAEERELLNRYGSEFADYMRRVPRFFPKWP